MACSGLAAINRTERLICGPGAATTITAVRGAALAGRRAATLLSRDPPTDSAEASARFVHHRIAPDGATAPADLAFHLLAASAQEAVDHCLVAHRIAAVLDRPGVCTIDRAMARSLHLVRIPDAAAIQAILDGITAGRPDGDELDLDAVWQVAAESCAAVAQVTGRPGAPLLGDGDGELTVITAGSGTRPAREAVSGLRAAGMACRLVTVSLVHPVTLEELAETLAGSATVAVLEPSRSELGFALSWQVRAALGDSTSVAVHALALGDDDAELDDLTARIEATAGVCRSSAPAAARIAAEPVRVGMVPPGPWSDAALRELAALLGRRGHFDLEAFHIGGATALVMGSTRTGEVDGELDLLIATRAVDLESAAAAVRPGGTVILGTCEGSEGPPRLSRAALAAFAERSVRVAWLDLRGLDDDEPAAADRTPMLLGAALAATPGLASMGAGGADVLRSLSEGGDRGDATEWRLLTLGASSLQWLDTGPETGAPGTAVATTPTLPVALEASVPKRWLDALRHFHLTGEGAHSNADPVGALPLEPAALAAALTADPSPHYPLVMLPAAGESADDDAADNLGSAYAEVLASTLDQLEETAGPSHILQRATAALAAAGTSLLQCRYRSLGELFEATATVAAAQLEADEADGQSLDDALAQLRGRLPVDASVIGLGSPAPLELLIEAVRTERSQRIAEFRAELGRLVVQLTELLRVEESRDARPAPEALSSALGQAAPALFDVETLARTLPGSPGSKPLGPQRRGHIEHILTTLGRYLATASAVPELVVFQGSPPGPSASPSDKVRLEVHAEGLGAAMGYFDSVADDLLPVFRAVRAARLEVTGSYLPEHHDPALARMDWQSLTAAELLIVPTIVVVETARWLLRRSLSSFSSLMRSGRPLQLLVLDTVGDEDDADLSENHLGIGYLAVAHREAFVLQGTLARPRQLLTGLRRAIGALRPSVAVVACPSESATAPWLELSVALHGRSTPCFCYDPGAGISWAERFDMSLNPDPRSAWPACRREYVDVEGRTQVLEEPFTFAHAAATSSACRAHFRVLPVQAWSVEQVEIADYLARDPEEQRERIPYMWVIRADGELARAVMTREMVHACRDRLQAWYTLQELAGTDNEYARRAAVQARLEAESAARDEAERMTASHAEELERAHLQAAAGAVGRLAQALLGADDVVAPVPTITGVDGPRETAVAAEVEAMSDETATTVAVPQTDDHTPVEVAYIDSPLCTTCHDCINLNNRMFRYDDNKQAYLADRKAGTFAELVKAAEACPGRCIHPGIPPDDDASVTPALIERARKFD